MIRFADVSFRYDRLGGDVLRDINLSVDRGIHLLLGENGAGKTTFLHLAATLLLPTAGEIAIDGADTRLRLPSTLGSLFFLGDNDEFPARSIAQMARLHGEPFYPHFSSSILCDNLDAFGINSHMPLAAMSLGQRKKAMVAYALALRPDFLLLDEPANGFDIGSRDTLRLLMARCIEPRQTVVVSTHTTADLQPLFDGIIMLRRGSLLFARSTASLAAQLGFATYNIPPRSALFTMSDIGRFRSIVPADPDAPTDIDIHLLYSAMQSPEAQPILNIINSCLK